VYAQDACGQIIVVDGDSQASALVVRLLRRAGYAAWAADCPSEALAAARQNRPRLLALEVELPDISGFEVVRELRNELGLALPIMFLSSRGTDPLDRVAGLDVGADDYLAKPFFADELLARVRALLRRSEPPASPPGAGLTAREHDVLSLLAQGLGQGEIAGCLNVTPRTVGNHIEHILAKLGVHSRAQAVACAYREHLVTADSTR
jgi:two-component system nitrate/nitrite response regulator NarL